MESRKGANRLIFRVLRPFWRMRRGLTMGAQGVVVDTDSRVLLVKHGYRPGWHFPGGGVEWGETVETAMRRELAEETGVVPTAEPLLHGIFANFARFPGDHVTLFIVRAWERPTVPAPTSEIVEARFFALGMLPLDIATGPRRRIAEIFEGKTKDPMW